MELPIASPMLQIALDVMVMDRHDPLNSWPQAVEEDERAPFEESPLALGLEARAYEADAAGAPASVAGLRLAAAAIDYHRREQKSFWWEHFARLADPLTVSTKR